MFVAHGPDATRSSPHPTKLNLKTEFELARSQSEPLVIRAERLRHHSATDRAVPRSEASGTVGAPDLVRVRATVGVMGYEYG